MTSNLPDKHKLIVNSLSRLRQNLKSKLISKPSVRYWENNPLNSPTSVYKTILESLQNKSSICVARIGAVEAEIILWSRKVGLPCYPFGTWPITFADTKFGATNAGIKPYTRESYRDYGDLAYNSLSDVDHFGVWRTSYESVLISQLNHEVTLCEGEHFAPTMDFSPHWIDGLNDKHILIVSPFQDSIQEQIPKIDQIWPSRHWFRNSRFSFYRFPYLIDYDTLLDWREVYDDVAQVLKSGEYDVVLFGCGGLGLPLAALAKRSGITGFHLGGHLQLVFGIYGNRHLEQSWHQRCINSAWIRPLEHEVPQSAKRVENACYW